MIDDSFAPSKYNRFDHLDEIEDRVIYYLISMSQKKTEAEKKQTEIIWKLLCYGDDYDALNMELPSYQQVRSLISDDSDVETQNEKRIFRSPHFDDAWASRGALIKIYIDSIIPKDRYKAVVNIGIDVIVHNKSINIAADDEQKTHPVDVIYEYDNEGNVIGENKVTIQTKSRVTTLVKAILSLLNGASIQGVGQIEFSTDMSRFQQAQYGVWNNRNYEGIKLVMGCWMSGVS